MIDRQSEEAEISPEDVLCFWLGAPGDPPLARASSWWQKDDAFDRVIAARFGPTLERGVRGELAGWESTPRGRLALVILFDQLSRNMFRGTARSFAQDPLALRMAQAALAAGDDAVLTPIEATFLLMPLMHAEDRSLQKQCLEGFERLAREVSDPEIRAYCANSADFARRHMTIIERFGRFPHRNGILGRETSAEETTFLKQPGSSF